MLSNSQDQERVDLLLGGYNHDQTNSNDNSETENELDLSKLLAERCFYAGNIVGLQKRFYRNCGIYILLAILLAAFVTPLLALIVLTVAVWIEFKKLDRLADRRAHLFERDYSAFLLSFAASVRTGLDPLVAFTNCSKLFPKDSLLKTEIEKFRENLDRGRREEKALSSFASSIRHPDIKLLRSAVVLARKQGSSLAECLQRLARITRQRQSFRRKMKAAIAMQRMSAVGISCCAFIIAIIQGIANPEGLQAALANPMGQKLLGFGVGLMFLGLFWMLRIAKERV